MEHPPPATSLALDRQARAAFEQRLGIAPLRAMEGDCIAVTWVDSPLGPLIAGACAQGLVLLEFSDRLRLETQFKTLRRHFRCPLVPGEHRHLEQLRTQLARYFDGRLRTFTVPLACPGTGLQQKVWDALQTIPYGQTWSYEALAQKIGRPAAIRAVGSCNGANRIAIVVPCHRVIGKDGALTGYAGGLRRKQALLDLERRAKA